MTAAIYRMPKPTLHLHCAKCGVITEAQCGCGAGYVTAGEYARRAIKANPEKSDRAIAEEIGVSRATVDRARKATGSNEPVEKRTGKDGKKRRMPAPKHDKAREVVRPLVEAGKSVSRHQLAADHGLTHGAIQRAEIAERARHEAAADPIIDPATLSLSMQKKNEIWRRQEKKRLEIEIDMRLRNEQRERLEELVLPSLNKRRAEYEKVIKARKGPLSKTQYRLVERCLHPDNSASAELRSEAFQMFRGKKLVLVAENEAPTESPTVPTTVAEWEEMKRKASR